MLRHDFTRLEIAHTDEMSWQPSPMPGVWRKRLERHGPEEAGRVTSVVRYDPGRAFREHPHPDGEEIFVISGVFSDHTGDHGAGSYLLNPEGFAHAPSSEPGCTLFVKLRQYPGAPPDDERRTVRVDTAASGAFAPHVVEGVERCVLYREEGHPEQMHLLRIRPGIALPAVELDGGEEIFVLEGSFSDEHGAYRKHSWVRYPHGTRHQARTDTGCLLYVKKGHLRSA